MNITCVIGARGGSKGLLGKNYRLLLNKPLIAWSIEQALACKEINKVIVSTDSDEIKKIALNYGAEVPFMRPEKHASDYTPKWDVWKHALDFCDQFYDETTDLYIDLDCTSPLRDVDDISKAIQLFNRKKVDVVFTICNARKNPYFNLVEHEEGFLKISKKLKTPIIRRQDAPKVYEHVASIYVLSPEFIRNGNGLLSGKALGYDIGEFKSLDVDSELDFELIEFLMKKKLGSV